MKLAFRAGHLWSFYILFQLKNFETYATKKKIKISKEEITKQVKESIMSNDDIGSSAKKVQSSEDAVKDVKDME